MHNSLTSIMFLAGLLDVDLTLPAIFILFIIFAFVINLLVFKPLLTVLEERERITKGAVSDASHILDEYKTRLDEYNQSLNSARQTSYLNLEKQRAEALKESAELLSSVKTELQNNVTKTKADFVTQIQSAKNILDKEAIEMASLVSSAIFGYSGRNKK